MSKTIILPSCDDGNRGDQALVWQTREVAEAAGLADECLMMVNRIDSSSQSAQAGIGLISPILRHPSAKFSPATNISYGNILLIVWGAISLIDGLKSLVLLSRLGRLVFSRFLTKEERRTLHHIATADACFVKGGGFIHTTDSITDPYKAYYFLYHVFLAQSFGKKVYVMPNSFGPLKGSFYQWIVRRALSGCEMVTSRETISQDMLAAVGVDSMVYPDLAFGLTSEIPGVPYLDRFREKSGDRPVVGITARPYRFPGSKNPRSAYANYIKEMANFARWLFAEGYFPVFVEHVVSSGEHESDISAIHAIASELKEEEFGVFQESSLNCRQLKSIYGECDFVVGTRFHSVIFAISEGTPAIAIGYGGNKGRGIMRDIGFPDYVIPIETFTSSEASILFDKLKSDPKVESRIRGLTEEAFAEHKLMLDRIKES